MLALLGNVFILLIHRLLNNSYFLFQVSIGRNFKTNEILAHIYADFFLLQRLMNSSCTCINIQWCISQTQQNFIMFIIVLGQHISILIESSSGPSKIQILT